MTALTWRELSPSTPQEHDAIREAFRALVRAREANPPRDGRKGWTWGGKSA